MIHHSGLIGGAGISLYYLWERLQSKYDVSCYIPDDPPELFDFLEGKGLKLNVFSFRLGKITYYSGGNTLLNFKFWYHALHSLTQVQYWKRVLEKEDPDLVIVNSKVLCWMGLLFSKYDSLCFVRETIPGNPQSFMNRVMRWMLELFSSVAFLSQYDLEQTDLKKAQPLVSPDFLYVNDYKDRLGKEKACGKLGVRSDMFNVLFVGGINELKGIDLAIQAIGILREKNITLLVAGNYFPDKPGSGLKDSIRRFKTRRSINYAESIKSEIATLGIQDKVDFIGVQEDISTAYSASDILIFPMKKPHQARPAFEIGVQKKPVVITDFPNISEYVVNEVNGLTFKPNDPSDLASAIERIRTSPVLYERMGRANYEFTLKYHLVDYAMDQLVENIDQILDIWNK